MITGIIIALPEELSTLTKGKLNKGETLALSGALLLSYSGAGPDNARVAAEQLIAQGVQQLISWGCGAALKDTLKPGDLVVASELIAESGAIYDCDPHWQQHIINLFTDQLTISGENLAESSTLVSSSEKKQALQQLTGAAIVDMESVAIAKTAAEHLLPFIAIRAIADPVHMNLPDAVAVSLDSTGVVQLPKLLQHLLTHPQEIPSLIRLSRSFSAAKKTLCLVAKQLDIICGFQTSKR